MNIVFRNRGILSLLDLTTMGDSSKREDESKIGKFDSGLKYAMAILFRNNIKMEILSGETKYTFDSEVSRDNTTGKTKELMVIYEKKEFPIKHTTAFSPQLGYNWELWMAFRELYSNCLDEEGSMEFTNGIPECKDGYTTIIIHGNDLVDTIIRDWGNYFIERDPVYIDHVNNVSIYENTEDFLKIYKNGILIYEDRDNKATYSYEVADAEIDERRVLSDRYLTDIRISQAMCYCNDMEFISKFLSSDLGYYEKDINYDYSLSDEFIKMVNHHYNEGTLKLHPKLKSKLLGIDAVDIGERKLRTNCDSYSWSTQNVKPAKEEVIKKTFEEEIKNIALDYNFNINYPIIQSGMDGKYKVLPDLIKGVLYVDSDFNGDYMWQLVKAHFRIESENNADYIYKRYVKLLEIT